MSKRQPNVEAIVKSYETPANGGMVGQPHPFAGEYTRLKTPIEIRDNVIPCDLTTLCRTAKAQPAPTYAFIDGHRYDLTKLSDVMHFDSAVKTPGEDKNRRQKLVTLKAKGHGKASIDSLTEVYHVFVGDPEADVDYVENGDS
jgi:hypothetical protein